MTTSRTIHNAIGYWKDSAYYHFIKDHLGNVCAVVKSETDELVQSSLYYASGVPTPFSTDRGEQPYLYNGKELVEAPSVEYNVYDYGFRGYYAPIGRFTSVDPLAEQTPWQSPYVYAGNNFANRIDYMGLYGMSGYNLTGVNSSGVVVYHDNSSDHRVFLVGEDWKEGDPVTNGLLVGWEIWGIPYKVGTRCDYLCLGGRSVFSGEFGTGIPRSGLEDITYNFSTQNSQEQTSDVIEYFADICKSEIFEYNLALVTRLAETSKINTEYVKVLKSFSTALTIAEGYNLYQRIQSEGWTLENISDAVSLGLGIYASKNPEMLIALICIEGCKILGQGAVNMITTINTQCGDYNFMLDIYWNGY